MIIRLTAAVLLLSSALAPVHAGEQPKGPPKTMGDQPGKLPSTGTMSDKTPDMRGPEVPGTETTGSITPKGPEKRMGDEGKMPPTGIMREKTPDMKGAGSTEK